MQPLPVLDYPRPCGPRIGGQLAVQRAYNALRLARASLGRVRDAQRAAQHDTTIRPGTYYGRAYSAELSEREDRAFARIWRAERRIARALVRAARANCEVSP